MKKIFFILTIAGFVFTSCGNEKKQEEVGSHTHADGTVYSNDAHSHENDTIPEQESFEVELDSTYEKDADVDHQHNHDQDSGHDHDDELGHESEHERQH